MQAASALTMCLRDAFLAHSRAHNVNILGRVMLNYVVTDVNAVKRSECTATCGWSYLSPDIWRKPVN